jgi:hypothetical protein
MCLSNSHRLFESQDDDSMRCVCVKLTFESYGIAPAVLKSVSASRVKERECQPC